MPAVGGVYGMFAAVNRLYLIFAPLKIMKSGELSRFKVFLRERLSGQLPGKEAHMKMVPGSREKEFIAGREVRKSAAMLLLYPKEGAVYTVLIRRPLYGGHHSGQISLPGGKPDPADADLWQTALRETREETGWPPEGIELIGALSELYIPPSQFLLSPFLAFSAETPAFSPDPKEVDRLIEADIEGFATNLILEKDIPLFDGRLVRMPYFDIQGEVVWGATGMIMSEFAVLKEAFN